ncbi:hypothetical protein QBC44DRAFT_368992 [Cladorrhinum sp. PSN332]|nr:hypothetical protein QBC44DRAFT_368992 [Cladorrhinum sp. PSN332]
MATTTTPPTQVRIPLTTTFTPPPTCFTGIPTEAGGMLRYNDVLTNYPEMPPALDCYPPSFPSAIYSPGLCPSGFQGFSWYPYGTDTVTNTKEHGALCCLSGFEPAATWSLPQGSCTKHLGRTESPETIITYLGFNTALSSYMTTSHALATHPRVIWHPVISIMWQDGDFPEGVHPVSGASSEKTSSTLANTLASATSTESDKEGSSGSDGGGLSSGAKTGVGIGAAIVGVVVLLILIPWLLHKCGVKTRTMPFF